MGQNVETGQIFIWRPRDQTVGFNTVKIQTLPKNGDPALDVTSRVLKSFWRTPCTVGIGDFTCDLINVGGALNNSIFEGDLIEFYADLTDGTTKKFAGKIDYVDKNFDDRGQVMKLKGRSNAAILTETFVNYSASAEASSILTAMMSQFLQGQGFTSNNVTNTGVTIEVSYDGNKTFWECVIDICNKAGAECWVDANKDFHFFLKNSIIEMQDAVGSGRGGTLVSWGGLGKDNYDTRDKVVVSGLDDEGLPIIYPTGSGARQYNEVSFDVTTFGEAQDLGDARKESLSETFTQGRCVCLGLPFLDPGENLWVSIRDEGILEILAAREIRHTLSQGSGWLTEVVLEREDKGVGEAIREIARRTTETSAVDNPNSMVKTLNLPFDDFSGLESHTNLNVQGGSAFISSGSPNSVIVTETREEMFDVTSVELRIAGDNLNACTFEVSTDNGVSYTSVDPNVLASVAPGNRLKMRITIAKDASTEPELRSVSLMYK